MEPLAVFPGAFHAAATPSCSPLDAAALAFYFTSAPLDSLHPTAPYVQVTIFRPLDSLIGTTWTVGTDGAAYLQAGDRVAVPASAGSLTVTSLEPDSTVHGSVTLHFGDQTSLHGSFAARWFPRQFLCG